MTTSVTKRSRRHAEPPKSKWEIKPSLVVRGFRVSPEEITRLLGVSPTKTWVRGDLVVPLSSVLKRKDNAWLLAAPCAHTEPLTKQVEALLTKIAPAAAKFRQLPQGSVVELYCAIYDYERSVVIQFSKRALHDLAEIGAGIGIDYYDLTDWEE